MADKTKLNDLVLYLTGTTMKPVLDDKLWKAYGYSRRPKSGSVLHKMFPDKFELEDYITKEVLTMGLIDNLNAIKKSNKSTEEKLLIVFGVIDQFLETTKHMFTSDSFMDNLLSSYSSYVKCDKTKIHEPWIIKSKDRLNKKNFAKFMVGTITLLGTETHNGDFFLNTSILRDTINNSIVDEKLKVSLSEEKRKKYLDLLSNKILNI